MSPSTGGSREFRLEGWGVALAGAVLVGSLFGAFWLGRWVERESAPRQSTGTRTGADPLGHVEPAPVDPRPADFFDTIEGGDKEAEPRREAKRRVSESGARAASDARPAERPSPEGLYVVQVFAGRDRKAAEAVVSQLEQKGWTARLSATREGAQTTYKVRVGGWADRTDADAAAGRLQAAGHAGAWVVRNEH